MLSFQPRAWLLLTKCSLQFPNVETETDQGGVGGDGESREEEVLL